jgi:hypothetical protein
MRGGRQRPQNQHSLKNIENAQRPCWLRVETITSRRPANENGSPPLVAVSNGFVQHAVRISLAVQLDTVIAALPSNNSPACCPE